MTYESTRNRIENLTASQAILQGLSKDGGLYVPRNLGEKKLHIEDLLNKDYYEIAIEVLSNFLDDFTTEEVSYCVYNAYKNKFSSEEITPLVKLKNGYVLELFNGPTSAFKDVALSILPYLMSKSLEKSTKKNDILILTATSGDTGKAALEGFKDVDRTKIMVFYPNDGVSKVQEAQMKTQEGQNVKVCAIEGNFDDAQTAIKNIFLDENVKAELFKENIELSSANSINIGRLVPQIVYYVYSYCQLVKNGSIKIGEKINFVVPTGNFGNILAGYFAKQLGLPINKLVCASNSNNVLYDFLTTGYYNKNREFLKTNSPSMDILISSNVERLLYYISGKNNEYIAKIMKSFKETGEYRVTEEMLKILKEEFSAGYCSDEETKDIIKRVYDTERYLLDTHTAVAYKVLLENEDSDHISVVLSTASPYKFTASVYEALNKENVSVEDEFELMDKLNKQTKVEIPNNLKKLDKKEIKHSDVIEKDTISQYILEKVREIN